ncbi:hypothetical protein A3F08_01455 [Candidatus Berkelbacteria bacterium RIFCSPHIGHO2_12_FULL_36_9]|uniref:DUF5652 domain-containing protein n=1 Tax=Candidatus Berkelbacteria bacterium RIFCSPHIGHO2_12_FULL_36_9 TaxID=1797469 RepID=A0A1F5EK75_9BACT|nr:MAG: hypothetical protein A3F08_01455 [Candidatus Berkelbacteria bacterium RIFCSPHIGHO2_12_FULL_36_9]
MNYSNFLNAYSPSFTLVVVILVIWSLIWKGIALWKAARYGDKAWFVALLIINTVGILEIFYIYVFSKRESKKLEPKKEKNE